MADVAIANDVPLYDTSDRCGPFFKLDHQSDKQITLKSAEGHVVHLFVLAEEIIRVMLLPHGVQSVKRTWAVAAGESDVPYEGIDKFDLSAFTGAPYQLSQDKDILTLRTSQISLSIELNGLICTWALLKDGQWLDVAGDRPTQSYNFGEWGSGAYHYLRRSPDEMYFGLGEKSGDANRAGSVYRMQNVDGAFYSARTSDPLYKHIPFYITYNKAKQTTFGLFYDTYADCQFDMGREISNYHGAYRYFKADSGDLDFYFIAGGDFKAVVSRFTWLTGQPMFPPKWSLGYSGSTMTYTDAPNAQERMYEFVEKCRYYDIPCESFHMSSGYTMIGNKRYVFNWNTSKFPDAKQFLTDYLANGIRVIANIKPALLKDHPQYQYGCTQNIFIRNAQNEALTVPFWGGEASYVDFTHPEGIAWWKKNFKAQLLDYGVVSAWNDNNEFEISNTQARAHGFGEAVPAREIKPLLTLLMLKTSSEAQQECAPGKRSFAVSRAGTAGMQRYVQTWSGDNFTSWETLKYNIKMGLGLAMSGVFNTGHDVGGFLGPAPDAELFVRWVQFGIFMPRFSIHSENAGGVVTEPWMYPEVTPFIRSAIHFRHQLQPYYYNLLWRAHRYYEPIVRPTYFNFPHDPACLAENDDMMIGDALLHPAIVEPGQRLRTVYLPATAGWYDFWTGEHYAGGQSIAMPAPLSTPLLFAQEGAIIPFNLAQPHFNSREDQRAFLLFPQQQEGESQYTVFEDDGESTGYIQNQCGEWSIRMTTTAEVIRIQIAYSGDTRFLQKQITLELPEQETRRVDIAGAYLLQETSAHLRRILNVEIV